MPLDPCKPIWSDFGWAAFGIIGMCTSLVLLKYFLILVVTSSWRALLRWVYNPVRVNAYRYKEQKRNDGRTEE